MTEWPERDDRLKKAEKEGEKVIIVCEKLIENCVYFSKMLTDRIRNF